MYRLFTLISLFLFLSGCALPVSDAGLLEREQAVYADIIVGQTTRAELIAKYGTPERSYGNSQHREDYWIKFNPYGWTQSAKSTTHVAYQNDIVTSRSFEVVISAGR